MAKQAAKAKPAAKRAVPKPAGKPVKKAAGSAAHAVTAAITALNGAISADRLDQLSHDVVQKLMAATIRAYSAKVQMGDAFLPFHPHTGRVAPTDVMITASAMLKAADLQVFELGMWQSYTGR